jgi:hypothetical protein
MSVKEQDWHFLFYYLRALQCSLLVLLYRQEPEYLMKQNKKVPMIKIISFFLIYWKKVKENGLKTHSLSLQLSGRMTNFLLEFWYCDIQSSLILSKKNTS